MAPDLHFRHDKSIANARFMLPDCKRMQGIAGMKNWATHRRTFCHAICWTVLNVLFATIGCTTSEPPRFTPNADVAALTATAETDEDKKLWQDLQQQVNEHVAKQFGTPFEPRALEGSGFSRAELAFGARVFMRRCQPCHGTNGDGNGPVAQYLKPLPRDYTKGVFKFTSTPYGAKPRRSDLVRTIQRGVPGTSMPAFADLPPDELDAVVDYVIYLSQRGELERELATLASQEEELNAEAIAEFAKSIVQRWQDAQANTVMPLTPMPPFTPESVAKGQDLFKSQACNKCHGLDGRGGTFGGLDVGKDVWGHEAAAADLTSGMFRGDGRPVDLYRRIYSGINGTPMPGFAQAFKDSPDDIWYLVHFIRDMGERRRNNQPPLNVPSAAPASPGAPPGEPSAAAPEAKAAQSRSRSNLEKST
jgi:mono/diheme cytochrome c family protein